MFGLLNLHKPSGISSRDAVNRVQRIVRPVKVGHAGTLDPLASGVLMLCLGPATRLTSYVQQMRKQYVGQFLLGQQSDTEDIEGDIEHLDSPTQPTLAEIEQQLPNFIGNISQQPPIYSALKVKGARAYDLARAGKQVDLQPRMIDIYAIKILDYQYPKITLDITCGSGTYVRSLGRDVARCVGTEAVMCSLIRTAIGKFHVDDALSSEELTPEKVAEQLIPASEAVSSIASITLSEQELERIGHGLRIDFRLPDNFPVDAATEFEGTLEIAQEYAALDCQGRLRSIMIKSENQFKPVRNFPIE